MGDSYREILVKKEKTTIDVLKKSALIAVTVVCLVGGIIISPILLLAGLVLGGVCFFVLPRFDLEYEYLYVNGELDIDKIMSKQKRKKCASYDMNMLEILAPSNSHALDSFYKKQGVKIKDYTSGNEKAASYTLVFNADKGQELVKLELDNEIVSDIRRIAPRKVNMY